MSEDSGGLSNSNDDELQEVIGENLPATINGDDEELQEEIGENLSATINGDDEEQRLVEAKKLQEKCLRLGSPVSPARLYCCYAVITVLTAVVIALSFALSLSGKTKQVSIKNTYATCPRNWIGFGNKCFYFSEDLGNQTFSQNYCIALKAQLARFDNQEELSFLKRYKGPSDHWIGLHRESSHHPWMWTDNTEYNNLFPTRGEGPHAYLSDRGISSGRDYIRRRWICSKPTSYALQCPGVSQLV
ncbi:C-type lectin domain family 2 member F-like isoform X2 [Chionomys nivalis]|uniref:C-type lectin domain family 2 member F-like isoform X2 n=1 Tax=Chionomys nivalis TaxID=269649 RepID=UPI002594191D|nr:C-type lectin domain family 2 member F-like isoform X2 [Chionomys nivalis]